MRSNKASMPALSAGSPCASASRAKRVPADSRPAWRSRSPRLLFTMWPPTATRLGWRTQRAARASRAWTARALCAVVSYHRSRSTRHVSAVQTPGLDRFGEEQFGHIEKAEGAGSQDRSGEQHRLGMRGDALQEL